MELDQPQHATEEDIICVGAQPILRLLCEFRAALSSNDGIYSGHRDLRLATIYTALVTGLQKGLYRGHAQYLADVPKANGAFDRFKEAIDAAYMEWFKQG